MVYNGKPYWNGGVGENLASFAYFLQVLCDGWWLKTNKSEKICAVVKLEKTSSPNFRGASCQKCLMYVPFDWIKYSLQGHVGANHLRGSIQDWQGQRCGRKDTPNWWLDPQSPKELNKTWDRRMSDPKKVTVTNSSWWLSLRLSNIPLEHTPDPEPTGYEGIPFIWGFRESWGMLQGYVGVLLDWTNPFEKICAGRQIGNHETKQFSGWKENMLKKITHPDLYLDILGWEISRCRQPAP